MGRIMAIDYGLKRTGIAVTDPLQIIASGLTSLPSHEVIPFMTEYFKREQVDLIILGSPKNWDDSDTHATPIVNRFLNKIRRAFRQHRIITVDERYTSKLASQSMIDMGLKKKDRQNKGLVDEVAATILLQEYLASRQ